jgi:hypothetical protein
VRWSGLLVFYDGKPPSRRLVARDCCSLEYLTLSSMMAGRGVVGFTTVPRTRSVQGCERGAKRLLNAGNAGILPHRKTASPIRFSVGSGRSGSVAESSNQRRQPSWSARRPAARREDTSHRPSEIGLRDSPYTPCCRAKGCGGPSSRCLSLQRAVRIVRCGTSALIPRTASNVIAATCSLPARSSTVP